MNRVEVADGTTLNVHDIGSGRPVVLLHGWALSGEIWDRQVTTLLGAGRRVVTVDLRGHGQSDRPAGGYDVATLAADIATVLDTLDLSEVDLVGWSLGGLAAFRVAARHAERIARLVLIGSCGVAAARQPGFPFGHFSEELNHQLYTRELHDRLASRESLITDSLRFESGSPQRVLDWLIAMSHQTPSWAAEAALHTLQETDQTAEIPLVQVPVVQIIGERDPVLTMRGADWVVAELAHARQVRLEKAGHFPMLETPDEFDAALLDALGGTT